MGVNKVEYGGKTLIDLTNDSVTPETLMEGETAHDASGEPIVGTMKKGGSENAVLSVFVSTGYMTYVLDIINAIQAAGGDTSKLTFVTLQGYLNRNIAVSFANYDGNIYHIDCIDLSNMAKIYNPDTDNTIDVASTRIGDFLEDGTPKVEMPQIRLVGATYNDLTKIVDEKQPLKLTVEIVGGGALQEGDILQICVKRTYGYKDAQEMPYRKQKLRQMCQYHITYDDLNKRFITIATDGNVYKWLFKNERATGLGKLHTLSPFYLRIKRVTKWSGEGQECDATFSNIVTVWKTYSFSTNEVNIK